MITKRYFSFMLMGISLLVPAINAMDKNKAQPQEQKKDTQLADDQMNRLERLIDQRFQELDDKIILLFTKMNKLAKLVRKPQSIIDFDDSGADDDYQLGKIACLGQFGKQLNYESALKHFKKAIEQDNNLSAKAGALAYLGVMYYNGEGVAKDARQAQKYLMESIDIVTVLTPEEKKEADLKGCPVISPSEEARAIASYYLGKLHYHRQNYKVIDRPSFADAQKYFNIAGTQTYDPKIAKAAKYYQGKLFYKPKSRVKEDRDLEQAVRALKVAAEHLEFQVRAWSNLGMIAYEAQNFEEAIRYFEKILDDKKLPNGESDLKHHARACYYLAELFFKDINKNIIKENALKYLELASDEKTEKRDGLVAAKARHLLKKYKD